MKICGSYKKHLDILKEQNLIIFIFTEKAQRREIGASNKTQVGTKRIRYRNITRKRGEFMSRVEYDTANWVESDVAIFNAIVEAEEQAIRTAQGIIDQYWIKFDSANRSVINNKKAGQDPKRKTAIIAPVVESAPSTGRRINRLIWRTFGVKGYQRANRGAGKRVAFGRGDYEYTYNPVTLLKYSVGWDAQSIIEAEGKLEPIRLTLKNYQRLLVSMAAKYRRIDRLNQKREKSYGE